MLTSVCICLAMLVALIPAQSMAQERQQVELWSGFKDLEKEDQIKTRFPSAKWQERIKKTHRSDEQIVFLSLEPQYLRAQGELPLWYPTFVVLRSRGNVGFLIAIQLFLLDPSKTSDEKIAWFQQNLFERFGSPFREATKTTREGEMFLRLYRDKRSDRTTCLVYMRSSDPMMWVSVNTLAQIESSRTLDWECGLSR